MRFLGLTSTALILVGSLARPAVDVTVTPTPVCPSGRLSVGTPGWIEAHKAELLANDAPRPADLSGVVMDHAGTPMGGVRVVLRRGSIAPGIDAGARVRQTTTDGKFQLDSLAAVEYVLEFRKPGFETQWHQYRGLTAAVDSLCVYLRAAPPFKLVPPETPN